VDLSGYLSLAKRWWWTLVVATVIAAVAGFLVGSRIAPTYASQATLLVGPVTSDLDTIRASGQIAHTYAELVTSQPILQGTIAQLGLPVTVEELRENVRASANEVTRLLTIEVRDDDSERAARVANSLAAALVQLATSEGADTGARDGFAQVIDAAVPSTDPVAPQIPLIVALAAAAGLLAAVMLVMLVEYSTDTVRDQHELARATDAPVLGSLALAHLPGTPSAELALDLPAPPETDRSYRLLASAMGAEHRRSVAVVDAGHEAIGAIIGVGVAAALADEQRYLAWIDAAAGGTGIGWLVRPPVTSPDRTFWQDAAYEPDPSRPRVAAIDLLELLRTDRGDGQPPPTATSPESVLEALQARVEMVIVSTGSVGSGNALRWAAACDATVVVARRNVTTRDELREAVDALRSSGARILGVVLAERPRHPRLGRRRRERVAPQPSLSGAIRPRSAVPGEASVGERTHRIP
jgi:capsular polysaccharide biosynthesis protein